jgi:hypothetical protein
LLLTPACRMLTLVRPVNDPPTLFAVALPLAERAERIRSLVNVARGCIIEIGRELIAAKAELHHGQWLPLAGQ